MAKTFDDMPKIENPLKNEPQGSFQDYRKKGAERGLCPSDKTTNHTIVREFKSKNSENFKLKKEIPKTSGF